MNRGNRQLPHLIAAIGGGVLFLSLFLEWLSGPSLPNGAAARLGLSKSGWELFHGVDIFLAILGIATIVYCVLWLLGIEHWPWLAGFVRWGGLVGLLLVLNYMVDQDNATPTRGFSALVPGGGGGLGIGVYVALFATLAMLVGGLLLARPDLARRLEEATAGRGPLRSDAAGGQPASPSAAGQGASPSTAASAPASPAQTGAAAPQAPPPARPQAPAAPAAPASPSAPVTPATGVVPPTPAPSPPQPQAAPAAPAQAGLPPEPPAAQAGPPAGWYPDPQGLARLRYWDGSAWTEHTSA